MRLKPSQMAVEYAIGFTTWIHPLTMAHMGPLTHPHAVVPRIPWGLLVYGCLTTGMSPWCPKVSCGNLKNIHDGKWMFIHVHPLFLSYVCACVCVSVCMCTYENIFIHVCIHMHICTYIYIFIYMCICKYHIYTYRYTYIYTHIMCVICIPKKSPARRGGSVGNKTNQL